MSKDKTRWRSAILSLLVVALAMVLFLGMSVLLSARVSSEEEEPALQADTELAWGPPNNPDSTNSTIGASPTTIRADGFSQSTITARIRDASNDVVPNQLVGFLESLGCGTIRTAFAEAEGGAVFRSPGHWTTQVEASSYGGQIIVTNGQANPTAYVEWNFWGEGATVILGIGPDGGTVGFDIDGSPIGSWNLYNPTTAWKVEKVVPVKLTAGSHTIRVRATNVKDPNSSGYMIRLDAFRSGMYTQAVGDPNAGNAIIPFTSSTTPCSANVIATVIHDGTTPWFTKSISVTTQYGVPTSVNLTAIPGTIPVGGSTSALEATVLDSFGLPAVDGTPVCFTTTLGSLSYYNRVEAESGDPSITFATPANWTTGSAVPSSGGAYKYTSTQNETVTWSFNGTNVSFAYYEYAGGAQFRWQIDGGTWSTPNIDSSPAGGGCNCWKLFSLGNLAPGGHTITVQKRVADALFLNIDYFGTCREVTGGAGKATNTLTSGTTMGTANITATVGYHLPQSPGNYIPTIAATATVNIVAGPPATVTVTPNPGSASCNTTRTFTARVKDAYGNDVQGVAVTFSCNLAGSWSANPVTTNASGQASSTFTAQQAGTGTVTATAGSINGTAVINVSPGPPVTVSCSRDPVSIYASGTHTATITLSAQDACGNPVADGTIVSFTTSLGTISPSCYTRVQAESSVVISTPVWAVGPYNLPVPPADGWAYVATQGQGNKLSWTFVGRAVGFRYARTDIAGRLRVRIDGVQIGSDVTAYLASSVWPATQWAMWSSPLLSSGVHIIEIEKRDRVAGDWAIIDYFETGCVTIGGTATATLVSTPTVGTATVIGYIGSLSCTTSVNFVPGGPHSVVVQPNPVETSCNQSVNVRARVRDQWGNWVADSTMVWFSANLYGTWGANPVGTASGLAQTTFTGYQAGTGTVTATVGSIVGTRPLIVHSGTLASVSVKANPTQIYASGIHTSTITLTATDVCGNCVEDGKVVTFTTNLGTIGTASGRVEIESSQVISTGTWLVTNWGTNSGWGFLYSNTIGDWVRWTFRGTSVVLNYYRWQGQGGTADIYIDGVKVTTINTGASGGDGWVPAVVAEGLPFALHMIEVRVTSASFVRLDYFEARITAKNCQATTTLTSVTTVGTATVTGYVDGMSDTATVDFIAGPVNNIQMIPTTVNATCGAVVTVRARPRDQWGNYMPVGTLVTFSSNLGGSFSPNPAAVAADGRATTSYTGHTAGTGVITATLDSVNGVATLITAAGAPSQLAISYKPGYIRANGTSTSVITVTVMDSCGNPIPGVLVSFSTSLGSITPNDTSDGNGVANATLTSSVTPGIATVTISAGAVTDNSTKIYFVGTPNWVTLTPSVGTIGISGCYTPTCTTLTASVRDINGYPAADGETVLFYASIGTLDSSPCVKFTSNGVATATLCAGTIGGTSVITAYVSIPGPDIYATSSVEIRSCSLFAFSFDIISTPQTQGVPFNVTIRAKDQYGNLVTGYTGPANLTSTPAGIVNPTVTGNFVNGLWTGSVTINGTGWVALQVCDGLVCAWSNVFQVLPPTGPTGTPTRTATATSTVGTATPTPTGTLPTATPTHTATRTPTPTATTTGAPGTATLLGAVTLQGRPAPPDPAWTVQLTVTVGANVFNVTTNQFGQFTIPGLTPGNYTILVKNRHTLSNRKFNVGLVAGNNNVNLGTLREGDASNDDIVDITDFSILRTVFGTADPRADFNQDGVVDITDFSLLRTNFGQAGPITVAGLEKKGGEALPGFTAVAQSVAAAQVAAASTVYMTIEPSPKTAMVGDTFFLSIIIDSGSQPLDAAQAYINFDPTYLQVLSITGGGAFAMEFQNSYDNTAGHIDYAAITLFGSLPSGRFTLATVQFRALAATANTLLTFAFDTPRKTKATYLGTEMDIVTTNGVVVITGAGPTQTATATATPTNTPTPTATGANTATPTSTPTVTRTPTATFTGQPTATPTATTEQPANVVIAIIPSNKIVSVGAIFTLDIVINAGTQPVDSAQAYIDFDPTYLAVVDNVGNPTGSIIAQSTLPTVLENTVDNALGRINYAAGLLSGPPPSGTFVLATIRLKAKAATWGTPLNFQSTPPRQTKVEYGGASVLGAVTHGNVVILATGVETPTSTLIPTATPTGQPTATATSQPGVTPTVTTTPQEGAASLLIAPATKVVSVGQIFTVDIVIAAGAQRVDSVQAFLDFDPTYLAVVDAAGSPVDQIISQTSLPDVLNNAVDNTAGRIDYAAGMLYGLPPNGTFAVATIRFKAKASTWGTPVNFQFTPPRQTKVEFAGVSVLGAVTHGNVIILAAGTGTPTGPPTATPTQTPTGVLTPGWTPTPTPTATSTVLPNQALLVILPPFSAVNLGDIFILDIVVHTNGQAVDSVQAHINFDPTKLQVVDAAGLPTGQIIEQSTLPNVLANVVDNAAGTIHYAAGLLYGTPPNTTFTLAKIRLKAWSPTGGTPIVFHLIDPRQTKVEYAGGSVLGGVAGSVVVITGQEWPTATATATRTGMPTGTPTQTATSTPTATVTRVTTPTPTGTETLEPTPTPTATTTIYTPTATPTITPTATRPTMPVTIAIRPSSKIVAQYSIFTLDIMIEAGSQPVDGAQAYLNFEPAFLAVVDAAGNPTGAIEPGGYLPYVLTNSADNTTGQITYAAGILYSAPPTGNFVLATIRFKALAQTGGVPITFSFTVSRMTRVMYSGADVLGGHVDGMVVIGPGTPPATTTPTPTDTPTTSPTYTPTATPTPTTTARPPSVAILIEPSPKAVMEGEIFTLNIMIDSGAQPVDGAQAFLDFDPNYLRVVDAAGNPASEIIPCTHLQTVLRNVADNAAGQIEYAAGALVGPAPSGHFCLATIRFKAKAGTPSTAVSFSLAAPRLTNVTYDGASILGPHINGVVVIQGLTPTPTRTMTRTITPTPTPTATRPAGVTVAVEPSYRAVAEDDIFALDIVIRAGTQPVDGAQAYLDFAPAYLEVVDAAGNPTSEIMPGAVLNTVIQNSVDNTSGRINYAAGKLAGPFPSGTFVLATVRLRAKAPSGGTWLIFNRTAPRQTNVVYNYTVVLELTTDGLVVITEEAPTPTPTATATPTRYMVRLPLIAK